jgi:hypothetical protein
MPPHQQPPLQLPPNSCSSNPRAKVKKKAITEKAVDYLTMDPSNASASLIGNHTNKANISTNVAIDTKSPHQEPSLPPSLTTHLPTPFKMSPHPTPITPSILQIPTLLHHNQTTLLLATILLHPTNPINPIWLPSSQFQLTSQIPLVPARPLPEMSLIAPPHKNQIQMLLQIQPQPHLRKHHHHSLQAPIQLQPSTTNLPS